MNCLVRPKVVKLKDNIADCIDTNAVEMTPHGDYCLDEVVTIIGRLNGHICGKTQLSNTCIEALLDRLVGYYTLTLELPIDPPITLRRAVKYDKKDDLAGFEDVGRLSYCPPEFLDKVSMGRLNKAQEALYYGCLYFEKDAGVNVAFAEINARKGEKINILESKTTGEINARIIGIYDYVKRAARPWYISEETFAYYKKVYDTQEAKYAPRLFAAFQLCDAFFADIMRRKAQGRLYEVTSLLGAMFLENRKVDGVLYTSVQAEGAPVIALKTKSVDDKIIHTGAASFKINKVCGYALYFADDLSRGQIVGDKIEWAR